MASSKRAKILRWIGVIVFLLVILGIFSDLIVKYLWLDDLGYSQVFWTIKGTQVVLFFIALLIACLYLGINIRFITKNLAPLHLNLGEGPGNESNVAEVKPKQVKIIFYILALVISIFFAVNWSMQWDEFLRFFHMQDFNVTDPLFDKDAGFYVFKLSFLESVQNSLIILVFFVTAIMLVYQLVSGNISLSNSEPGQRVQTKPGARKQIFTNLSIWLVLLAWGYYLDRFQILNKQHDIIYGANYTDVHVMIPVFWIMLVGSILMAIYTFLQNFRNNTKRFVRAALALLVIGIVGQVLVPMLVQNYKVAPSEFTLEKKYIKNNIEYTRKAYNLDEVKVKSYTATDTISFDQVMNHEMAIKNIRIWDQDLTVQTYKQLQEIRLYYEFHNIDLDRYHTKKGYRQVLIAARELTPTLPPNAQTWVNSHLQYTHGFGVVMSPSTQKTKEGSPNFYIQDIPPKSSIGLEVDKPAIYYGEINDGYKLVNTKIGELHYPREDKNVYNHYEGDGGVSINSFFEQLLFSWQFGDINLLLTDYIRQGSKIQFWRAVKKRVHKVAPFLKLDNDPYIVLSDGKLYWMQDAYTTASHYPYSKPYQGKFNYIRNSIKVVMDAYQGTVNFYFANPNDPVIQMYQEIFPHLFQPLEAMPGELEQHIKYPKDLFEIQLRKFSVYHMNDPQVFYNREDAWERPTETYGGQAIKMNPYYMLGTLPDSERLQYMLISPMTPRNRDNMISWMVVKSDFPGYGQIINYELPKEKLFLGPAQIEAKINQNTEISRQLSLWDQRGSRVIRGNLMVIPIENSFLYVEPVFLFSTSVNIPQLKRVIATTGTKVVMEPTLKQAIFSLYGKKRSNIMPTDSSATRVLPKPLLEEVESSKLNQVEGIWQELQNALENRDWKTFGEKMNKINDLLDDGLE